MKLKTMLASLLAVASLTACEDLFEDGSLQPDGSNPSVTVNNPSTNQTITAEQGLLVNITAVDKDKVKELDFALQSVEGEQKSLLSFSITPDMNVVEFDTLLNVEGIKPGMYNLVISASDFRTNLTVQEVPVTIKASKN